MYHDRGMQRSPGHTYFLLYYLAACLLLATAAIVRPFPNWDSILYAASARGLEIHDTADLHHAVYEELAASVSPATYAVLTAGPYRGAVSEDTEAFRQQLPFYRIRILYIMLIFVVSLLGMNVFYAIHVVSAASVAAGMLVLFLAFRDRVQTALLLLIPIGGIPLGLLSAARYGTPDGLAFFVVCLTVLLLMRGHWLVLISLPVCILVRTDLIVFVALLAGYLVFVEKRWRRAAVASLVVCAMVYIALMRFFDNYGLQVTYHMTFVETLPFPADSAIAFTWPDYFSALGKGLAEAITNRAFLLFVGIAVAITFLLRRERGSIDWKELVAMRMQFIMASSVLYVGAHFVVFPEIEERFFVASYVLLMVGLLWIVAPAGGRHR